MRENGTRSESTMTISPLSRIPVERWSSSAVRFPHPLIKAYQPSIMSRGLRRLFKTKTSAQNYALAVKMRYERLLEYKEKK